MGEGGAEQEKGRKDVPGPGRETNRTEGGADAPKTESAKKNKTKGRENVPKPEPETNWPGQTEGEGDGRRETTETTRRTREKEERKGKEREKKERVHPERVDNEVERGKRKEDGEMDGLCTGGVLAPGEIWSTVRVKGRGLARYQDDNLYIYVYLYWGHNITLLFPALHIIT